MLRTLQTFFEYRIDDEGKPIDNRHYFEGLRVMEARLSFTADALPVFAMISWSLGTTVLVFDEKIDVFVVELAVAVNRCVRVFITSVAESGIASFPCF